MAVASGTSPHFRAAATRAAVISSRAWCLSCLACSAAAARAGWTSPPGERSRRCASFGGRSLRSIFRTRSRTHSKSRFTKPGDAGGSGRSAAMASARARSESVRVRRLPGRPVSVNSSKRSPVRRHAALEAPGNCCSASRTTRCSQLAACRRSRLRPATPSARSMSIGVAVRGQDGFRSSSAVNSAASPPGAANSSRRRETRLRSASAGARASSRSAVVNRPSPLPSC